MARVCHFEIHADDPARAMAFYESALGWSFQKWDGPMPYWMIITGPDSEPGINGGLLERPGDSPVLGQSVNSFVCTVTVASVDETFAAALKAGGTVAMPKFPVPGVGWLAYVHDTEGNIFGLMQSDPTAG